MKTVTIHEAKTHLSRLVQSCVEGEEIVITRGNLPVVKLVPAPRARKPRRLGLHKGLIAIADDFEGALDDFKERGQAQAGRSAHKPRGTDRNP